MKFYCIQSSYKNGSINTLEIDGLNILMGSPLPLTKLLHYLPNFGHFMDDRLHDTTLIKQKLGKAITSTTQMQIEETNRPEENDYYLKLNEKYYMKTAVKFDVSAFDNIDISTIDYILLSNIDNVYALPYITEYTKFKGEIYATTPVSQITNHLLRELQEIIEFRNKKRYIGEEDFFQESEFYEIFEGKGLNIQDWLDIYTLKDIENCFQKIKEINFNEIIQLNSNINVRAICSGYSIGSCNWLFQSYNQSIAYISRTSLSSFRHCLKCDIDKFKNCNIMILEEIINNVNVDYSSPQQNNMYETLVTNFIDVLSKHLNTKNSSNVLIPISNLTFLLDLIDIFKYKLSGFGAIHIISSSIEPLIAYANINFEYINTTIMNKIYTQNPETPFNFDFLEKAGRFFIYNSIDEFQEKNINQAYGTLDYGLPSIYIVAHSSFRLGLSARFFDIFEKEQNNKIPMVMIVDPYMQTPELLSTIITKKVKIIRCPLDGNISMAEMSKFIEETNPKMVILPQVYKAKNDITSQFLLNINPVKKILTYKEDEELNIELSGSLIKAQLGQDNLKIFDSMKKLTIDLNLKLKIYKVQGEIKKNNDGKIIIDLKENKNRRALQLENNKDNCIIYMLFNNLDSGVENLSRELEKIGFLKLKLQKLANKTKNDESHYKLIFRKQDYHIIMLIGLYGTRLYYSNNFKIEMRNIIEQLIADKFGQHFILEDHNIFS